MTESLPNFLPNFLGDANRYLTEMRADLQRLNDSETPARDCDKLIRQIFQTLHTLKGSATIFELNAVSGQAHDLETTVCAVQSGELLFDKATTKILSDGLDALENLLRTANDGGLSVNQTSKAVLPINSSRDSTKTNQVFANDILPTQISAKLNERERARLATAAKRGDAIFVLEVSFEFARFAEESARLRGALPEPTEIIATLPGDSQIETKLVLQFVAATTLSETEMSEIAGNVSGKIVFSSNLMNGLSFGDLCEIAFAAGRQTAARSGKTVDFTVSANELTISGKHSAAISTALLHLMRNAVAHGIETPAERIAANKSPTGKITVETKQTDNSLQILISDDGRGIDREKLLAKIAGKSKLSGSSNHATEQDDLLAVIFQPGFSTSATINIDAGRGIGLDAVVAALEKVGGSITVASEIGRGTVFTIALPAN